MKLVCVAIKIVQSQYPKAHLFLHDSLHNYCDMFLCTVLYDNRIQCKFLLNLIIKLQINFRVLYYLNSQLI